ncbi:MAG: GlsB/YeaQ/YmgE family stress response membrane protein [Casimicrobium sp.]|jgi:uncharacterized membrane protein YeaQ/YmgE (transglycosylase-associated protein family)
MNVIIWLVIGSVVVWLTVLSMSAGAWQALQQDIVVGMAGAILGGYLLSPLIGAEMIGSSFVNVPALVMAALGALSLLNLVKWLTTR